MVTLSSVELRLQSQYGIPIRLKDLNKSFGSVRVLNHVNLEIQPGEFVAIVGRSGCGKSTLLRLIAGLETPSGGEVRLGDRLLTGLNREARMMFQDSRLLPWKRVLENVSIGSKRQGKQYGLMALSQVGLGERSNAWTTQLSGGQRQRVALARALVSQPRLLLLDEPLGALDALTRIEMQQLIQSLWQEQKFTAVLVTHDVEEAVYLADRVIVIEQGQIHLDLSIDLPRPRHSGDAEFARTKSQILDQILQKH